VVVELEKIVEVLEGPFVIGNWSEPLIIRRKQNANGTRDLRKSKRKTTKEEKRQKEKEEEKKE
jgi:hypothetical protein